METTTEQSTPSEAWRVSTHNSGRNLNSYIAQKMIRAKNGGWKVAGYSFRLPVAITGKGATRSEAVAIAAEKNSALGWKRGMVAANSKGLKAFEIHLP